MLELSIYIFMVVSVEKVSANYRCKEDGSESRQSHSHIYPKSSSGFYRLKLSC